MPRITLYREPDGTAISVDEPLTESVDLREAARQLGLPAHLDLEDPVLRKMVVVLWAASDPHRVLRDPSMARAARSPVPLLLFGGAAIKMLCPSANQPGSPFWRSIGDLDLISTWKDGGRAVLMLTAIPSVAGTSFTFFTTKGDKTFNALRGGSRYRVRMLERLENGLPRLKDVDIFTDEIELRHTIRFKEDFEAVRQNLYTVGPEKLLLSKLQVIMAAGRDQLPLLESSGQGFRILDYASFNERQVLVGMEKKDLLDVCCLLHDTAEGHPGAPALNLAKLSAVLRKDPRFALTCRLNLENLIRREDWMREQGMTEGQIQRILSQACEVLRALPPVEKKWSKPWWNTDVETPLVA